jgi:hypothetical protein
MGRLTSTKHPSVDHLTPPQKATLASPSSETKSTARPSESKSPITRVATPTTAEQRIQDDHRHALPRHKSIRKRLGRLFVHFSRTQSAAAQETCEYRYSGDALELPAGGTPIAGPATLEEMPASFPTSSFTNGETFELEQPQLYTSMNQFYGMNEPCNEPCNELLFNPSQSYDKREFAGDLAMYRAPLQVATPKNLPRLAVPGSMHSVPAMTYDQSPHSASTISPNTPVGHFRNSAQPYWNSQSAPPLVSPCDTASTLPWYRHQNQHYQTQHSFESPLTPSSAGSASSTTMSVHRQSGSASFGAWPQPGPEYLRTAFPQRYQPINHESISRLAPGLQPTTWATNKNPHQCCHHGSHTDHQNQVVSSQRSICLTPQYVAPTCNVQPKKGRSARKESQPPPAIHIHDTTAHVFHVATELPPPAYSPVAMSPSEYQPATCEHCGKVFTGKYGKGNLTRHIRQVHESLLGGAIHMCRFCMKTYNRADALRKHSWKKHRDEDSRPNKRRRS